MWEFIISVTRTKPTIYFPEYILLVIVCKEKETNIQVYRKEKYFHEGPFNIACNLNEKEDSMKCALSLQCT